ncbi:hypothetical protein L1987_63563 [Smallanthus sonchifolius]|uniref:Uncharacterized protein n=1 Tax=Smallanthus sonchifolius TaxID=185202 RepID=A0ACB9CDK5_9ASTR|nr:hypothetical protein L1987_63563 [Smallanthus sonchifolius]
MEEYDDVNEPESQTGLQNLLTTYADGISMRQTELAKMIVRCINEKISPIGQTLERVAFNLFQSDENQQEEYLKQESMRHFKTAFRVFYDSFPYGRFAHFTTNSIILEAIPTRVESLHIVDFHLCEGSQWPPLIQAIARIKKSLIITSIKLDQDQDQDSQFDQTKMNLCKKFWPPFDSTRDGMTQMMKQTDQTNLTDEFMAFNCMVGLPHLGITRTTTQVKNFLKIAKRVLSKTKGIITFGDGKEGARTGNCYDFSSFFNKNLAHYNALYESMEWGFPSHFNEGRMTMETLFVSPFIKSKSWIKKWEEGNENMGLWKVLGLKGVKMSEEWWNEARELVKEGESQYGIGIEGENGNEMVLERKGTPLVKVSTWVCIQDAESRYLTESIRLWGCGSRSSRRRGAEISKRISPEI